MGLPGAFFPLPARVFAIPTAFERSRTFFGLTGRLFCFPGRLCGLPDLFLSSRPVILASKPLSRQKTRDLVSRTAILVIGTDGMRSSPVSCFRSAHPAPKTLIRGPKWESVTLKARSAPRARSGPRLRRDRGDRSSPGSPRGCLPADRAGCARRPTGDLRSCGSASIDGGGLRE